jgi:hypothetical protein
MKSKSKSSTKPVYSAQVEGAANNVTSAYNAAQPGITATANSLASAVPGLMESYNAGQPGIQSAMQYNQDVTSGKYLNEGNPYLQGQIDQTNAGVRNGLASSLGTRGLTGGSAFGDIISSNLAKNENNLRFADYTNERNRMDSAASAAGGISAAQYQPLSVIQSILQSQQAPVQAAAGAGSSIGGLLGSYTNGTQTQSMGLGQLAAQLGGSALSAWAGGGFK